jgi:hypothetical protein
VDAAAPHEKWFERSFDFTLPTSRFPSLIERLRGTSTRLEERKRHDDRHLAAIGALS